MKENFPSNLMKLSIIMQLLPAYVQCQQGSLKFFETK